MKVILLLNYILVLLLPTSLVKANTPLSFFNQVLCDYQTYYSAQWITKPILGLGLAGIMANTNFDQSLQNQWQDHFRGSFTNKLSYGIDYYSAISQYKIVIPLYLTSMWLKGNLGVWGNHSLRTLFLGMPQQAILTCLLGGGRPETGQSEWHLFKYHRAVSGHAFYGAIPLLNFAQLTCNPYLKATAYGLSILPGLARINLDKHYSSQAFLGWWLALMATNVVWYNDIVSSKAHSWTVQIIPTENSIYLGLTTKF